MNVAEINEAAKDIFACDESVVGKSLEAVQDNELLAKFSDMIRARFEGEIYRVEGVSPAGDKQMLSFSASPLTTEEGADYGYVLIIRDETNLPDTA